MRPTSIAIRTVTKGHLRSVPPSSSSRQCLHCTYISSSVPSFTTAASSRQSRYISQNDQLLQHNNGRSNVRPITFEQRRGFFFGIFSKQEADPVDARGHRQNPGINVLANLVGYMDEQIGFQPDTGDLVAAFDYIVTGDERLIKTPGVAYGLCRLFDLLGERGEAKLLNIKNVDGALSKISRGPDILHIKLASFLFQHLQEHGGDNFDNRIKAKWYGRFASVLSRHRKYEMAIELCKNAEEEPESIRRWLTTWAQVMKAYVEENDEKGLYQLVGIMKEHGVELTYRHYDLLMALPMQQNDLPRAKEIYNELVQKEIPLTHISIYKHILEFCVKHKDQPGVLDWGNDIFKSILSAYTTVEKKASPGLKGGSPEFLKATWELALQWCAITGRSIDEIERLMSTLRSHPSAKFYPDIETINGLVEFWIEEKDAYKAERFAALAQKWGFEPNRRSLVLQVYNRILGGDVEGARLAWHDLRFWEIPKDDEAQETFAMLRALSQKPQVDPEHVTSVYSYIRERKLPMDVETLCVYLQYMMKELEIGEFVDVLTRDVIQYGPMERKEVIQTIYNHIVKDSTSEEDGWELYRVAKDVLLEMDGETRRGIMNAFFRKGRIDMGSIVFTHMRHSRYVTTDKQAYMECIEGVARGRDERVLMEMINLLRIDPNIELDTQIRNTLIWGYQMCGLPFKAMEIYDEIKRSEEGPDQNTLIPIIATCGVMNNGMGKFGISIWKEFKAMGFEYNEQNYAAYIQAWINNGNIEKAFNLAKNMEANIDIRPGPATLYTLYTEMPPMMRNEVMKWIKENYQVEWDELLASPERPIQAYHETLDKIAEEQRQAQIEHDL